MMTIFSEINCFKKKKLCTLIRDFVGYRLNVLILFNDSKIYCLLWLSKKKKSFIAKSIESTNN